MQRVRLVLVLLAFDSHRRRSHHQKLNLRRRKPIFNLQRPIRSSPRAAEPSFESITVLASVLDWLISPFGNCDQMTILACRSVRSAMGREQVRLLETTSYIHQTWSLRHLHRTWSHRHLVRFEPQQRCSTGRRFVRWRQPEEVKLIILLFQ